jgi:hypothetical protein
LLFQHTACRPTERVLFFVLLIVLCSVLLSEVRLFEYAVHMAVLIECHALFSA